MSLQVHLLPKGNGVDMRLQAHVCSGQGAKAPKKALGMS